MIVIRKTVEEDIPAIYEHIHLEYVKKYCSSHEKEEWEKHKRWYMFLIHSSVYMLYTIEDEDGRFLGTVKFELRKNEAVINIYLVEALRGRGYSEKIIVLSLEELKFEKPSIKKAVAYILEENEISLKAFTKAGFKNQGRKEFMGIEHLYYTKDI